MANPHDVLGSVDAPPSSHASAAHASSSPSSDDDLRGLWHSLHADTDQARLLQLDTEVEDWPRISLRQNVREPPGARLFG